MHNLTILGIESSCDETAAAVYTTHNGVLSNCLFSQIELHKQFGGVVPELASRSHLEKIIPIIDSALKIANITLNDVDVIGVTTRPGLPGSLLIGLCTAKALASYKKKSGENIKLIGVNHLEGHAFSACIDNTIPFPFLCLTASGGHTSMYVVTNYGEYSTIGSTLDDAAGEAFDKIAKLVNLGYPGGPIIEKLAREVNFQDFFNYPRAHARGLDFSFSGLKTAVLYDLVNRGAFDLATKTFLKNDDYAFKQQVASSLLCCIKDIFVEKIKNAVRTYPEIKAVAFVGGVACNQFIRDHLQETCVKLTVPFFIPRPAYCTDNAAMIAYVAHYKAWHGEFDDIQLDIGS